jgi:hypothetical protein
MNPKLNFIARVLNKCKTFGTNSLVSKAADEISIGTKYRTKSVKPPEILPSSRPS